MFFYLTLFVFQSGKVKKLFQEHNNRFFEELFFCLTFANAYKNKAFRRFI